MAREEGTTETAMGLFIGALTLALRELLQSSPV